MVFLCVSEDMGKSAFNKMMKNNLSSKLSCRVPCLANHLEVLMPLQTLLLSPGNTANLSGRNSVTILGPKKHVELIRFALEAGHSVQGVH